MLHKHGQHGINIMFNVDFMNINAKIKVAVSIDKQRTLIRIYMEKYNSV